MNIMGVWDKLSTFCEQYRYKQVQTTFCLWKSLDLSFYLRHLDCYESRLKVKTVDMAFSTFCMTWLL